MLQLRNISILPLDNSLVTICSLFHEKWSNFWWQSLQHFLLHFPTLHYNVRMLISDFSISIRCKSAAKLNLPIRSFCWFNLLFKVLMAIYCAILFKIWLFFFFFLESKFKEGITNQGTWNYTDTAKLIAAGDINWYLNWYNPNFSLHHIYILFLEQHNQLDSKYSKPLFDINCYSKMQLDR